MRGETFPLGPGREPAVEWGQKLQDHQTRLHPPSINSPPAYYLCLAHSYAGALRGIPARAPRRFRLGSPSSSRRTSLA